MSGAGDGKKPSRFGWVLPVAVVIAVGVLVYVIVTTVANGTFV